MTDTIRTAGQIRQQLKQVLFRHLQKLLKANFRKSPDTCHYCRQENLGDTGMKVGVCRWDGPDRSRSPRGKLCDSRVFGCAAMAGSCGWWRPFRGKDDIKAEFKDLMTNGSRGQIAALYPDAAALMWVLDGIDVSQEVLDAENEADPPEPETPPESEES